MDDDGLVSGAGGRARAATYTGVWTTHNDLSRWLGVAKSTSDPLARVSVSVTPVACSPSSSTRATSPRIRLWVDGQLRATVDPATPAPAYRRVVVQLALSPGAHTLAVGLAPGETDRLEFEGFVVLLDD